MAEKIHSLVDLNDERAVDDTTSGEEGLKKDSRSEEDSTLEEKAIDQYAVQVSEFCSVESNHSDNQKGYSIESSQHISDTKVKNKVTINSQTDQLPEQDVISENLVSGNGTSNREANRVLEKDIRNHEAKSSDDVGTTVDGHMILVNEHKSDSHDFLLSNLHGDGDSLISNEENDNGIQYDWPNGLTVDRDGSLHLTLDQLPLEILMHIWNFLDAGFILNTLTKVCQTFQQLISRDIYWKTRINKRWPKKYPPVHIEDFDWKKACIHREEQYRLWTNPDIYMDHFTYSEGLFAPVDAVHLMQNGKLLASGSRDRYLTLLDLTKYNTDDPSSKQAMKVHSDSKAHKGWIWSLASSDGILATGSWDTYIKLWDVQSNCTEISKFKCKSAILDLHIEPGLVIAGGYDKQVYQIDLREGNVRHRKIHTQPVLCVAVDDNYIITGSEDKTVVVYDRRSSEILKTIKVESFVMDMCYANGQLWLGDKKGKVHLYDATHSKFDFVKDYQLGHTGKLTGIIYTLGALYTCSTDHTIRVSEPNLDPVQMCTLKTHEGDVAQIDYQNGVLASAGSDISIGIWRPKN